MKVMYINNRYYLKEDERIKPLKRWINDRCNDEIEYICNDC